MPTFDIKQLQEELEPFLSNAIAATVAKQPSDPVEFLAKYMIHEIELVEQTYKKRAEMSKVLEIERAESERLQTEELAALKIEQEEKEQKMSQAQSERAAKIDTIYEEYIQGIEKIINEQEDIDPDEDAAEVEGEGEEGDTTESENAPQVDEEIEEAIFDTRVQIIVAQRKLQQCRDSLTILLQAGLFPQYREPLQANADGSEIPPIEPSENVFKVLKALQILFDRPKKEMKVFHPQGLRRYIPLKPEDLLATIVQYDPSQNQRNLKFRRAKQYLKKIDLDELRNEDTTARIISDFVRFSCDLRKYTKKLQSLRKEEVEAIPEDETDPMTKSELEYVDSDDEKPVTGEEGEGEVEGEGEEE